MEPRIERVTSLVTENLGRAFTLDELAREVNLSASRLRHLFKEEMGVSLQQYLKSLRLLKAKELLESTFLNIQEIMARVGIKDKSHFARDFKKAYKVSPLRYRTQYLKQVAKFTKA